MSAPVVIQFGLLESPPCQPNMFMISVENLLPFLQDHGAEGKEALQSALKLLLEGIDELYTKHTKELH